MEITNITVDGVQTNNTADLNELCALFERKAARKRIYEVCAKSGSIYVGVNEHGEKVLMQAIEELIVETYQQNGWVRMNYYDAEGVCIGEEFDGKWK